MRATEKKPWKDGAVERTEAAKRQRRGSDRKRTREPKRERNKFKQNRGEPAEPEIGARKDAYQDRQTEQREGDRDRDKERRAFSETDKDQGTESHSGREGHAGDGDPERDKLQEKDPRGSS